MSINKYGWIDHHCHRAPLKILSFWFKTYDVAWQLVPFLLSLSNSFKDRPIVIHTNWKLKEQATTFTEGYFLIQTFILTYAQKIQVKCLKFFISFNFTLVRIDTTCKTAAYPKNWLNRHYLKKNKWIWISCWVSGKMSNFSFCQTTAWECKRRFMKNRS